MSMPPLSGDGSPLQAELTLNPATRLKRQIGVLKNTVNPKGPSVPVTPAPPTVNQALIDQEASDTIRRRRGRSANVSAGNAAVPSSSLAVASLLGG